MPVHPAMDTLVRDLKLAVRALGRRPGISALIVLSLALAMGFTTAAFSVIDAYSWRELPVREPDRLAWIFTRDREQRFDIVNWIEYEAIAARAASLEGVAAQSRHSPRVRLPDRDDFPITAGVSDNFFDLLGVRAARGDVFHAKTGRDGTVVISDRYWNSAFGGDPGIVGRTLDVGGSVLTITGVLPAGFTGANRGLAVDLFVPEQTYFGALQMARRNDPKNDDYELIGRLRAGWSAAQARSEIERILRDVERDGLAPAPGRTAVVESFTTSGIREKLNSTGIFLGLAVVVLLIAGMNLAGLRLVDNESRRRDTAIRLALGAGRGSLLRQHLTEALVVSAAGAAFGLVLAAWFIDFAPALFYAGRRFTDYGIALDVRAFSFTAVALIAVALTGTFLPLSDAWKRGLAPMLQTVLTARPSRLLTALIIAQMAFVTAASWSAGLLWRSLQNVAAIRPAMDPDGQLLIVKGGWEVRQDSTARTDALAAELAALPGVERVAYARRAMLSGSGGGAMTEVELPGQPKFQFRYNQVSANYFAATGARVIRGRPFSSSDTGNSTPVILVNAEFARRFFPGGDPIGQWVSAGGRDRQIVGVVENGPSIWLKQAPEPFVYYPFAQKLSGDCTLFVQTSRDAGALAGPVRTLIRRFDSAYWIYDMQTLRSHMRTARSAESLAFTIAGGLAALALLLAAAGLFGVTMYAVARRTREFGVRVALGATGQTLRRQVLREAAVHIAFGLPLGWVLAWASRKFIAKYLYGVTASDPWALVGASVVVAIVALIAAMHPAWRASRVDPAVTLRYD